ncbi:MAG: PQQ-dependent sugar dehydrogenase [Terrimicrobiaceae bacterium]|nr:PQQ-dependent sugar dehydrogenase [Terrimicrobiaceae bacterium]
MRAEVIRSEKENFKVEVVADGLKNPWGLVELPDGRLLVTERAGTLRVIEDGKLLEKPVGGIPEVYARGQGGLLDIELHPDHTSNGWIYLAFSDVKDGKSLTKIIRGRLKDHAFVDQETIFEAPVDQYTSAAHHFGVRMEFDGKGHLFFAIGDRGRMENAQNLGSVAGKVHRIRDDGGVPKDNPFASQDGAMATIWTYGNRNIQGMKIHPETGDLWAAEHGPRGGDELNRIERGRNYGWPAISFGINYNGTPITDKTEAPGMEQPVVQWTPSIAVGGIDFYMGGKFSNWTNNLFATALAHQKVVRLEIDSENRVTHQEILLERQGRVRDVRMLRDGFIYLVYDEPGKIVRLVPAA